MALAPPSAPPTAEGAKPKGCESREAANAVSRLQEYIQSCSSLRSPHTKILTWSFAQESETALQFRATVSFVFNNVPHHFCGGWQTSKKKAQRDTAERVRHYLARSLREMPANRTRSAWEESVGNSASSSASTALALNNAAQVGSGGRRSIHVSPDPSCLPEPVAEELWRVFQGADSSAESELPKWELEERRSADGENPWRATVTFQIMGVPHHFAGGWCPAEKTARCDVAERVLWYFGRLAEGCFCASDAAAATAGAAAGPLLQLCAGSAGGDADGSEGANGDGKQSVEDKMILMQVHNALQKSFAKDTQPGERVWLMSYESDPKDLQLFRAIVKVPSWDRTFYGDWCKGKKLAQRSACLIVRDELSQRPPVPSS